MFVQSWADVVASSLQNLWIGVVSFLPQLLGALVVVLLGLIVAAGIGSLVEKLFEALRLDQGLEKLGVKPHVERAGLRLRVAHLLGKLAYWFLLLAFFLAASNSLGLTALSDFLQQVLGYLPNVFVAVLILLAAVVVANFLRRLVVASVLSARLHAAHFLGTLTWWVIVVFGFLAALVQLNIAASIINTLVTGFIAMLALAGGLAFGLGGRDYAAHLLGKLKDRTEAH